MMKTPNPSERPDFAAIYDSSFKKVYNFARWRVGDAAAADDVVSRVFEKALDALRSYDPKRAPVDVWLFSIARRCVADHFRAKSLRSWLPLDLFGDSFAEKRDDSLETDEDKRALLAALETLDARERELLALKFGAEMTNRDIARATGLGESNVGVIAHRAVAKLRAALGEDR